MVDKINIDLLKNYKAKLEGQSLYSHNEDLINILNQLNLTQTEHNKMLKIIQHHDVGKIVDEFQNNIDSKYRKIRHEIISASVKDLTDEETLVIITHHKSLKYIYEKIWLLLNDKEYSDLYLQQLQEVQDKLGIKMIDIRKNVLKYKRNKKLLQNQNVIKFKGLLNYCDHLGSAGVKELNVGIDTSNKYKFDTYTTVQKQAGRENDDIIIISGTGTGKTEASLLWANKIDKLKNKRLFYILPYTASINAMYKRLSNDNFKVGMLHSKAEYFLYKELEEDYTQAKNHYQMFKYFNNQVTISTIHQVFKALFNCKFNEMMLSMYNNSVFIIDEIHCYDEKQIALILTTLKYLKDNYNIHICIMSASIPTKLLELIQSELNIHTKLTLTKEENDKIKRHTINYKSTYMKNDIDSMVEEYKKGNKVLIVANTVKMAQDMYIKMKDRIGENDLILLHSNFNMRDRERIESEIKYKKVLIGTQAIEVSLDIDFDVMFTEISTIDSQIQRWGRINRKRYEQLKGRKNIYVYETESNIYNKDLVDKTRILIKNMGDVNENDIQKYLDFVYDADFKKYHEYKDTINEIFSNIQVGKWNSIYDEVITFSGANVLPECFISKYESYVEDEQYFEANSLFVNISEGKYSYALAKGNIDENTNYIYYDYDENIGLKFGEYNNFF